MSFSSAKSKQTQSQTTTQVDRRVGASDNAVVAAEGSRIGSSETNISGGRDVTIQSLDPETIKGAFGLSDTVVRQLSQLAGESVQGSQNLVERVSGSTTGALERLTSGFGRQLSDLSQTQATGGLSQLTKFIPWVIVALVAFFYLSSRK